MKRSEIISKLEEMLKEFRKDLNNGSDYADAEKILNYLENNVGMDAPKCGEYPAVEVNCTGTHNHYTKIVRGWEKE